MVKVSALCELNKSIAVFKRHIHRQSDIFPEALKPSIHFVYQQFKTEQFDILPADYVYVACMYLGIKSKICQIKLELIGFGNLYGKCLLRGTTWSFKIQITFRL
jgi:hypothetical protein